MESYGVRAIGPVPGKRGNRNWRNLKPIIHLLEGCRRGRVFTQSFRPVLERSRLRREMNVLTAGKLIVSGPQIFQ